jgi:hypothetical protein
MLDWAFSSFISSKERSDSLSACMFFLFVLDRHLLFIHLLSWTVEMKM